MNERPRREVLNTTEIAAMFGKSRDWWTLNREAYIKSRNFPRPLPGGLRRMWSRRMVERWFETGGQSYWPGSEIAASDAAFTRRLEDFEKKRRAG